MSLSRVVVANYFGLGWSTLMSLAFVPLYIHYLGIEAYGLVGLYVVIQAWLALVDMGMTSSLTREMARFSGGSASLGETRNLLRSIEIIGLVIAAVVFLAIALGATFIATRWLKLQTLSQDTAVDALLIIAFIVAVRFFESLYRSALIGLQRQVWLNAATALIATFRYGGAAVVVVLTRDIKAFFLWQALTSALAIASYYLKVRGTLSEAHGRAQFSWQSLKEIRGFAGGASGILILSLILNQTDKALLARTVPFDQFGYYMFAWSAASLSLMIVQPITQAFYPHFVALAGAGEEDELRRRYHLACQLVIAFLAPILLVCTVFGRALIYTWSGNAALAANAAPFLLFLTIGNVLNSLAQIPYHLQLAYGWTTLFLRTMSIGAVLVVPSLFFFIPRDGAIAAAEIWTAFNIFLLIALVPAMHRRLLKGALLPWLLRDVLAPVAMAALCLPVALAIAPPLSADRWIQAAFLAAVGGLSFLLAIAVVPGPRSWALARLDLLRQRL